MARKQEFVPPENLSWGITSTSLELWQERGGMMGKAHLHEVYAGPGGIVCYRTRCGHANPPGYNLRQPVPAPAGWPKCKWCISKEREVPDVIARAFQTYDAAT